MKIKNFKKIKKLGIAESTRLLITEHPEVASKLLKGIDYTTKTILGLSIKEANQIYALEFQYPTVFRKDKIATDFKDEADYRFYENVVTLINRSPDFYSVFRFAIAYQIYQDLQHTGFGAFLTSKKIQK